MKKSIGVLFIVIILLTACAPSASSKPAKPKAGHWEGSGPDISFDITDEGQIVNLTMSVPYGGKACDISAAAAAVQPDYTIILDLTSTKTLSTGYIMGAFYGTKVSGKYLIKMCSQGISFVPGEDKDRDWSAEWSADLNSAKPSNSTQAFSPTPIPTQVIATSIQPSEPTPTAIEIFATSIIDVNAQASTWFDTGISIQESDEIKIEASGTIDFGGVQSGPDGSPDVQPGYGVVPNAAYGALVGMIGSGDAFVVGSNYQETAQSDGNLKLLINDVPDQYTDNSGQFHVTITVTKGN